MADSLFGFPYVRQRRARIYRFNDSIKSFIEADLQMKMNCYYVLKPVDQVLIALQFYASGGFLQVVGDTTGVRKSTISLAVHSGRHYWKQSQCFLTGNCIMGY